MASRPYLTSAEAATYCGFKTIGGIQQAVRRGKLKPAGRRGGTGTYVFATAELDLFLTGGLLPSDRQSDRPNDRLFVAPRNSQVDDSSATHESTTRRAPVAAAKTAPQRPQQKPPARRSRKPVGDGDAVARIIRALAPSSAQTDQSSPRKRPGKFG